LGKSPVGGHGKMKSTGEPRFLVDEKGSKVGVLLGLDLYRRMREAEEELAAIRAFDRAKASGEKPVSFEAAMRKIKRAKS